MNREQPTYTQRITQNPEIMVGKPVVTGTRIPVERVLAHLAHNPDLTDLFAAYPELTAEDVKACLHMRMTSSSERVPNHVATRLSALLIYEVSA